jgi:hypothetical protein
MNGNKYCPNCGEANPRDAAFCVKCGNQFRTASYTDAPPAPSSPPYYEPIPSPPPPPQPDDAGLNRVELYKIYWNTWEQTLQERTDYNKYYTNLLFINALVAVLVAALGTSNLKLLTTNLVVMLLVAVFFVAAVVATGWCVRLGTIRNIVAAKKQTLDSMATSLHLPCNLVDEEEAVRPSSFWARTFSAFDDYLIPVSMVVVFGLLFFVMTLKYFGVIQI